MPVYTYRCDSCGIQFERHQSFQDKPLQTCPECRKKSVRRVITPSKVIFKGSGFYATDHKSPSGSSHKSKKDHTDDHGHDHSHDHSSHDHNHDQASESKPTEKKKNKSEKSE